jgi:Domain of unknown function (DUF4160)
VHIHVTKAGIDAKFWLGPDVQVAYNDGFNARVLRELIEYIQPRRHQIETAWNEYFDIRD